MLSIFSMFTIDESQYYDGILAFVNIYFTVEYCTYPWVDFSRIKSSIIPTNSLLASLA